MKHFYRYLLAAMCIILTVIPFALVTAQGASSQQPVIFISDDGNGDGTSPSSPLGSEIKVPNPNTDTESDAYRYWYNPNTDEHPFCKNSALYTAVERLASTGGKIVLVGDIKLGYNNTLSTKSLSDRDFNMPVHENNEITITSSYNGTSYGAGIFITEGARMTLGGKTKFENIKFKTGQTADSVTAGVQNRSISCNGYSSVFGDGITCEYYTYSNGTTKLADGYYPPNFISICGSTRFKASDYDTDITINSGTWRSVYGSSWGLASENGYTNSGNTKITVNGGTVYGDIIGTNREGTENKFDGNIEIIINGGTFGHKKTSNSDTYSIKYGSIYAANAIGVLSATSTATIRITGGEFVTLEKSPDSPLIMPCYKTTTPSLYTPPLTLDLSELTDSGKAESILSKSARGLNVIYPNQWFISAAIINRPASTFCFAGNSFDGSGLSVDATYGYNGNTYISRVEYDKKPGIFSFDADTSSPGTKTLKYKFAGVEFHSENLVVIASPVPRLLGAQIKTGDANEALRFVAQLDKNYGSEIALLDYGFISLPSEFKPKSDITFETVKGAVETSAKYEIFRPEYGEIYNSDKYLTFSGIYPDLSVRDFGTKVSAAAYVTFSHNGNTYTTYSNTVERSVLEVANKAINSLAESNDTKSWIQTNIINAYNNYSTSVLYNENQSDALRNIVQDSVNEYAKLSWMWGDYTKKDLTFQSTADSTTTYQTSGTYTTRKHAGMIYVSGKSSTIEEFKAHTYKLGQQTYYNGPMTGSSSKTLTELTPAVDYHFIPNAWNKVTTKDVNIRYISDFLPSSKSGVVAVGDYSYSSANGSTENIIKANGEQTMYEAYAKAKKSDGLLVCTPSARSIYIITAVNVVRNSDGTVNPSSSKFTYLYIEKTPSTSSNTYSHFKSASKTFAQAYNTNMIPVTVPELSTGLSSKTTTVLTDFDGLASIRSGYVTGRVQSNRHIISINVTVSRDTDQNGTVNIYDETFYLNTSNTTDIYSFDLGSYFNIKNAVRNFVAGKTYKINVSANVANEEAKTLVSWEYASPELNLENQFAKFETFDVQSDVRGSAVNAMYEMSDIEWTPVNSFSVTGSGYIDWNFTLNYTAGQKYHGVLYSHRRANLLNFKKTLVDGKLTYASQKYDWDDVVGSNCSTSMYQAMQLASRIPGTGFRNNVDTVPVGIHDPGAAELAYTGNINSYYGKYAIYESYAKVLKGDMLYKNSDNGGHTRMAAGNAVVVRKSDGSIDPAKSYIPMIEQTDTFYSTQDSSFVAKNGYNTTWWKKNYTFEKLYATTSGSVFYRTTEMITNESEMPYIGLTMTTDSMTIGDSVAFNGSVKSNYPINDIIIDITDSNGTVIKTNRITNKSALFSQQLKLLKIDTKDLPSGTYDFVLTVGIAAGEREIQRISITK